MMSTFSLTVFGWIFFRAESVGHALSIIKEIFSRSIFSFSISWTNGYITLVHIALIIIFIVIEWMNREYDHSLYRITSNKFMRRIIYLVLVLTILFAGDYHSKNEFIYFQF